jgi:hypothetical protein
MGILDNLESYIDLGDIKDLDLTEDIDKEDI